MSSANGLLAKLFLRYASPLVSLRRLPVVGPCLRWAGLRIVSRDALVWVQVRRGPAAGIWLKLNPRTGRDVLEGRGELEVQHALQRHVAPGMTFYDLGANIGFFTMLAAKLVGATGQVTAFEADPEIAARLREHATRNQFYWVNVEEKAVWSETRTVHFARADPNVSPDRGLGHVVASGTDDAFKMDAVSLDDYAQKTPAMPDFIKCDVEGAEVEVFRGAQRVLAAKRPVIVCEIHGDNRAAVLDELLPLGYVCTDCGPHHILALPQ
jgi:FkbM family methyltransferase